VLKIQTIVSTDWLAEHLRDAQLMVLDCRFSLADTQAGQRAYASGHIPGAHYVDLDKDLCSAKNGSTGRHPLPQQDDFNAVLRRLGLTSDKRVVIYDDANGMYAARLWWMLRWVGFTDCAVLDGGWHKWLAEGRAAVTELPRAQTSDFAGQADNSLYLEIDDILQDLNDSSRLQLLDARSAERFRGENETMDPVSGHIPGALNRFYQNNLDASGTFKSAAQLREEFNALLGARDLTTVVHQCGSGVTACHNLLAMEIASLHGTKLYPGSWSEWCADEKRPVKS
jgi:thiosulfate/3-mercaptopyruvate sulfurtransferase